MENEGLGWSLGFLRAMFREEEFVQDTDGLTGGGGKLRSWYFRS